MRRLFFHSRQQNEIRLVMYNQNHHYYLNHRLIEYILKKSIYFYKEDTINVLDISKKVKDLTLEDLDKLYKEYIKMFPLLEEEIDLLFSLIFLQ